MLQPSCKRRLLLFAEPRQLAKCLRRSDSADLASCFDPTIAMAPNSNLAQIKRYHGIHRRLYLTGSDEARPQAVERFVI